MGSFEGNSMFVTDGRWPVGNDAASHIQWLWRGSWHCQIFPLFALFRNTYSHTPRFPLLTVSVYWTLTPSPAPPGRMFSVGLFVAWSAYNAPASLLVELSEREPKPSPVPSPVTSYSGSLDLLPLSSQRPCPCSTPAPSHPSAAPVPAESLPALLHTCSSPGVRCTLW